MQREYLTNAQVGAFVGIYLVTSVGYFSIVGFDLAVFGPMFMAGLYYFGKYRCLAERQLFKDSSLLRVREHLLIPSISLWAPVAIVERLKPDSASATVSAVALLASFIALADLNGWIGRQLQLGKHLTVDSARLSFLPFPKTSPGSRRHFWLGDVYFVALCVLISLLCKDVAS